MAAGRDVDLLLWAVAEARRLRTEELARLDLGVSSDSDAMRTELQYATDWQQPIPTPAVA